MKQLKIFLLTAFFVSSNMIHAIDFDEGVRQMTRRVAFLPISNADQSGGIITLDQTNNYKLKENIEYPIVIDADHVGLNLNCYSISHNDKDENIITVNANKKNIKIFNGYIFNTDLSAGARAGSGILVNNSCSNITLNNLEILDCGNGVKFDGSYGSEVIECELSELDLTGHTVGINMIYAQENTVEHCTASTCSHIGFCLNQCEATCVEQCKATNIVGAESVLGFKAENGKGNLFKQCVSKKIKSTTPAFANRSYGIVLEGTEEQTKVIDCIVNEITTQFTAGSFSYGIALNPTLFATNDLFSIENEVSQTTSSRRMVKFAWSPTERFFACIELDGSTNRLIIYRNDIVALNSSATALSRYTLATTGDEPNIEVAWSPDGRFLVVIEPNQTNTILLFKQTASRITLVQSIASTESANVRSVAWSPDGAHVAIGVDTNVHMYEFNGTTLSKIPSFTVSTGVFNEAGGTTSSATALAWSPDGRYLAAGLGDVTGGPDPKLINKRVVIFAFNGIRLFSVAVNDSPPGSNIEIRDLAWSDNGAFLAAGFNKFGFLIYKYSSAGLANVAAVNETDEISSLSWSPAGDYIIVAKKDTSSTAVVKLYSFNGTTVTFVKTYNNSAFVAVAWSPSGAFIASGLDDTTNKLAMHRVMSVPSGCVIINNNVSNILSYEKFVGTAFSGGLECPYFNNIACSNETDYAYGIANVFYSYHNTIKPFDNVASQISKAILEIGSPPSPGFGTPQMAMA